MTVRTGPSRNALPAGVTLYQSPFRHPYVAFGTHNPQPNGKSDPPVRTQSQTRRKRSRAVPFRCCSAAWGSTSPRSSSSTTQGKRWRPRESLEGAISGGLRKERGSSWGRPYAAANAPSPLPLRLVRGMPPTGLPAAPPAVPRPFCSSSNRGFPTHGFQIDLTPPEA